MRGRIGAIPFFCFVMACGGPRPEDAVSGFLEAMKAGDGEGAVGYLSQPTIDDIGSGLEELRADTTGLALGVMDSMFGMTLTLEQIDTIDSREFAALLLGSRLVRERLETAGYSLGRPAVTMCSVPVTYSLAGDTIPIEDEVTTILEDGVWKLHMPEFGN
jgi:hypothetical protein